MRLELFEAKWAEVLTASDTVNLEFVRNVVGKSRIAHGGVICRATSLSTRQWFPSLARGGTG